MAEAMVRPVAVTGAMSPKPTVVMVVMAQYTPTGMLVKPCSGPSTTYIRVPITTTTSSTKDMNTAIFRREADSASARARYSSTYWLSFRIRKMRSSRSTRTSTSA